MSERILVTGATGKLGREIVRILLADGETVRAATRFPSEARNLFGDAVEVVEMDYESTETWDNAVQWVDRLFLTPPPFDPHAFDTLAPFLDWAVASGIARVVLLSGIGVEHQPGLALHRLEQHLAGLGLSTTVLRPNLYMQNLSSGMMLESIRQHGRIQVCAPAGLVSFVDAADVALVATKALTGDALDGVTATLTGGEAVGFGEVARRISIATGRSITLEPISPDEMRDLLRAARWPRPSADVAVAMFESIERGERAAVKPDLADILGRIPRTLDDFIAANASVWT